MKLKVPYLSTKFVRDGGAVFIGLLEDLDLGVDPVHLPPQLLLPFLGLLQAVASHLLTQPPQRCVRLLQLYIRHF